MKLHAITSRQSGLKPLIRPAFLLVVVSALCACGGTGLRKNPIPMPLSEPVGWSQDDHLRASVDHIIVRDGPGSWARNADWDQYQLTLRNLGPAAIQIESIMIIDAFETAIAPGNSRKNLVHGSREVRQRYDAADLDVKSGAAAPTLVGAGAATTALGVGTVSAAGSGALVSGGTASLAGASAVASGLLVLGPALVATGVVRGINNWKVDDHIKSSAAVLPMELKTQEQAHLDLYFPIVPVPVKLVVAHRYADALRHVIVDISVPQDDSDIHALALAR